VFTKAFASVNNVAVEFYEGDGSYGAAIGAGIGAGFYSSAAEAARNRKPVDVVYPAPGDNRYEELYEAWEILLKEQLKKIDKTNALSLTLS
jgi:xylulokinase